MSVGRPSENLPDRFARVVHHLVSHDNETEWLEFKHNNDNPQELGEYISALSNSATLHDEERAYMLWGVESESHRLVGTNFNYRTARVGGEELISYLSRQLAPSVDFRFSESYVDGFRIVMLEIPAAVHAVVRFRNQAFLRIGSYKKRIEDFIDKERTLWAKLRSRTFENEVCRGGVMLHDLEEILDVKSYFRLAEIRAPERTEFAVDSLIDAGFVKRRNDGDFDVTNLGGILFARDLREVGLERKSVRVVRYRVDNRLETIRESESRSGYACGFSDLLSTIEELLPTRETIARGLRQNIPQYPAIAIRELLANALVHQDFTLSGMGPMVEIFGGRVEISNPGAPLIHPDRFIDKLRSRNEKLAAAMRRLRICEERGSGIDKVILGIEADRLPAPAFRIDDQLTRVTLFAARTWRAMTREDRVRACYQHAAILYVHNEYLTNGTLRKRFALPARQAAAVSRVINDALSDKRILRVDDDGSRRNARYAPYFAATSADVL